ncbi:MAG: hypothetical protein FJX74_03725 [Armatimonadetes bacterium]|nr:hypothetical protein [Armatimonadota bacterium]
MNAKGRVRKNRRTKHLVLQLRAGEVALIDHRDLDGPAAEMLAECRPAAVLNAQPSMTGEYPNRGPAVLAAAGIPLYDLETRDLFERVDNGTAVTIEDGRVLAGGEELGRCARLDAGRIEALTHAAEARTKQLLLDFAENTLEFIRTQPEIVLPSAPLPETKTPIWGRHVVIVARGPGSHGDLETIRAYIQDVRPVLIGVDGGADILAAAGFRPDLIVGDLDSAGELVLRSGAEVLVHAYADGRSPGARRAEQLGLTYRTLTAPGTSEDAALALAFEKGAELIVMVGSHTNLPDFLEKGRHGMASTFLTRLKVGDRLVDAKGVRMLYQGSVRVRHLAYLVGAALLAACGVLVVSPFVRGVLQMAGIQVILAMRDAWRALFG